MTDQLNDWTSCNPKNYTDKLPEPYRFINKILQKEVLLEVFNKVFLIEKYRADPNYEGPLRMLPPQGIFEITNITTVSKTAINQLIAAGDSSGNLMILDINKKTRICKKEISNKRINKVVLSFRDGATDDQKNCCILAVILHLDPVVQIFKYKPGENQLSLIHTIQVTRNNQTIGELPIDVEISKYSQYIMISQYNGSVLVYKIPELKVEQQAQAQSSQQTQQQLLLPPIVQQKLPSLKDQQKPTNPINQNNQATEIQSTEITELFYQIKFQGIKKEQKFDDIINSLSQQKEQNQIKEDIKDEKKKITSNPVQKKQEVQQQILKEEQVLENQNNYSIKYVFKDGIDFSENYPAQNFQPQTQFILDKVGIRSGQKAFENYKQLDVVVGIMVGWTNTKKIELHYFSDPKIINLPLYIQYQYSQKVENQVYPSQQNTKKKEIQIKEISLIYTLTCMCLSKNNNYGAFGLIQGSILIFDIVLQQEKFYLDKHQAHITHIEFCEDSRLVSCGYDGSVHVYNINEGTILCKRTNQFRKGTKVNYDEQKLGLWRIINMSVSNSGIAVVQDYEGEVRIYDAWRGEKIAKLSPTQVMDDQIRKWSEKNIILQCFKNEILISSQVINQKEPQMQQTSISIFKIFDNLVNLFPSLSNVFRKGVEKDKIMNLFQKISKSEIFNSQFEVPNLLPNQQNTLRVSGQDQKLQRNSQAKSKNTQKSSYMKNSQQQNKVEQNMSNQGQIFENRPISLIGSLHKSSHSDRYDFNSSFRSSNSPQNAHASQNKKSQSQQGLTKEMLHPEQHLLEKQQYEFSTLVFENSSMVDHCKSINSLKQLRAEKITQSLQKLGQKLAMEDEKMRLQYRYKQLQKTK